MCVKTATATKIVRGTSAGLLRLPPLPTLRDLIKLYRLQAIRQLSQNFLLDEKLTNKIAKAAGKLDDIYVCEVGPGPGGITRSILAKGAKKVILIEKDVRFQSILHMLSEACPGKVQIHWGDVLSFNMSKLFPEETRVPWEDSSLPPIRVIGNLPFNVATPLIIKWLKCISERSNVWSYGRVPLILTFQKEVAERLAADIMDGQRSRLSIMSQHLCKVEHKFTISGNAFLPKPDVDVGVVKFTPLIEPLIKQPFHKVEKVVRHIVHYKSHDVIRGIGSLFPLVLRTKLTDRMLEDAYVKPTNRPLQLSVEEYGRLCDAYVKICEEYPVADFYFRDHKAEEDWEARYGATYGYSGTDPVHLKFVEKIRKQKRYGQTQEEFDYDDDDLQADPDDDLVSTTLETCQPSYNNAESNK